MARDLTWVQVDFYLHGYEARRQKDLAGHRLTAALVYNALADKPLKPAEFLHLPAVDGWHGTGPTAQNLDALKQMRDRLAAENFKKQAAKAA